MARRCTKFLHRVRDMGRWVCDTRQSMVFCFSRDTIVYSNNRMLFMGVCGVMSLSPLLPPCRMHFGSALVRYVPFST